VLDFRRARDRRRFYLERGLRKQKPGGGSALKVLMARPRERLAVSVRDLFGDVPVMAVGAVAAPAYAPERTTAALDIIVELDRFVEASANLRAAGWAKRNDLVFPNASLGLRGETWKKDASLIDLITTDQPWGHEAFAAEAAFDPTGLRVIPLAYLVLMKLDSARGIDQGDLTRMLGRLTDEEIDGVAGVVRQHARDPQAAEDVRQYAALGGIEWDPEF
jgi:hypothetical protein